MLFIKTVTKNDEVKWVLNYKGINKVFGNLTDPWFWAVVGMLCFASWATYHGVTRSERDDVNRLTLNRMLNSSPLNTVGMWHVSTTTNGRNMMIYPSNQPCASVALRNAIIQQGATSVANATIKWSYDNNAGMRDTCWGVLAGGSTMVIGSNPIGKTTFAGDDQPPPFLEVFAVSELDIDNTHPNYNK